MSGAPRPPNGELLAKLQCPVTGQDLQIDGASLVTLDGTRRYRMSPSGVPLFGEAWLSEEGAVQRTHYDRIAGEYLDNLAYPHTREYMAYFDRALLELVDRANLHVVAEVCCGAGDGFQLLDGRVTLGIGVDVSPEMLEAARRNIPDETRLFVQGDAVRLPIKDSQFDTVFMLGGIHHVNDRDALFGEVHRILKPGGAFIWREPVDDFWLWRFMRRLIYRWSPTLQEDTEHPLRFAATKSQLERAGFTLDAWRTLGFLGYCFLMNSDVLPINRVWNYVPGARALTRMAARVDDWSLRLPGLAHGGPIAVGLARRR